MTQVTPINAFPEDSISSFDPLLTPESTASALNVTTGTLAKWRSTGKHHIPFLKLGTGNRAAIRYEHSAVEDFKARCRANGSGEVQNAK